MTLNDKAFEHDHEYTSPLAFFYTGDDLAYLVMECVIVLADGTLCCESKVFTGKAYSKG